MVCDLTFNDTMTVEQFVLILILLEYGLRPGTLRVPGPFSYVLILILLEYGLRHNYGKKGTRTFIMS